MTETIGMRIAECRKRKGLTQFDLAELLCTKKSTISSYENDKIDIKISILIDIAKILDTTISYLTEGKTDSSDLDEIRMLFLQIDDDRIRRTAIEQVRLLAGLCN